MPNLVNAYVIYNGTQAQYVGDQNVQISINCERLQAFSPRPCYLKRFLAPGDGTVLLYEPTFGLSSQEASDANTLYGFWIEQDGQDVMVDVTSIAAFQAACDACCGSVPTIIANNYAGAAPAFVPLTINTLCVTRSDDGSAGAHDAFAADYVGQYIGIAQLRSNVSGVSKYQLTSYWNSGQFPVTGSDTVAAGACTG